MVADSTPVTERPIDPRPTAGWRFWIPMLLQLGLAIGIPAQSAATYYWGRSVVLQTRPVDPYDWLRGYSQTLSYDISQVSVLKKLRGWESIATARDDKNQPQLPYELKTFYIILQEPAPSATAAKTPRPQPWQPVAVQPNRPDRLPPNQIALRGDLWGGMPRYNLETYYMEESQRDQINREIGQLNRPMRDRNQPQPFVVEVRVDGSGSAVAHSLWIEKNRYQF